jgi:hypothetical protein
MRQHAILVAAALLVGSLASAEDPTSRDNTNAPKELQNTTPNKAPIAATPEPATETSQPPRAQPANLPRIEMVRVKPSDSAGSEYPLSLHDGEVDLMRGFSLSSSEGIGSAWKAQSSTETFDDRFGRW